MILLEFQTKDGVPLQVQDLGTVISGHESEPVTLRIANIGDEEVMVQVYPDKSSFQNGLAMETYRGTLLSLNNFNYAERIYTRLPVGGFTEFFVKWSPYQIARTGDKQWSLCYKIEESITEVICGVEG